MDRRQALLKLLRLAGVGAGSAALGFWLDQRSTRPEQALVLSAKRSHTVIADAKLPEMVIAQGGDDPAKLVRRALEELGGIRRFVARADIVVVKPNIGWDRTPEQAANTNPSLVAEVVRQCWDAGAKKVIVADVSCNDARRCFQRSGIAEAARSAGAEVILPEPERFKDVDLQGEVLQNWPVFEPFLAADKIINIPIAKHHSLSGATLGMKNWYGILGGPTVSTAPAYPRKPGGPCGFHPPDADHHRCLPGAHTQWSDRRQRGRCHAQADGVGGNRSGRARCLCGQGLLESGPGFAAIPEAGRQARPRDARLRDTSYARGQAVLNGRFSGERHIEPCHGAQHSSMSS